MWLYAKPMALAFWKHRLKTDVYCTLEGSRVVTNITVWVEPILSVEIVQNVCHS